MIMLPVTGDCDYSVYSRKGGVDPYLHTFVQWASDWRWIEQTLNSRRSPSKTEVFFLLLLLYDFYKSHPLSRFNVDDLCV